MKLIVLGSSSKGNCYILLSEAMNEAVILEAGCKPLEVKKAFQWHIPTTVACFITHEHGDHAKYAKDINATGITVAGSKHVLETCKIERRCMVTETGKAYRVGQFLVQPFDVSHDVPCQGFIIRHPEMGKMAFITDTYYCSYRFSGITTYLIEANYSDGILDENVSKGKVPPVLRDRLMTSHMEIGSTVDFLRTSDLSVTQQIILIHLSNGNSDRKAFIDRVRTATGLPTEAAAAGDIYNITKL